MELEDNDYNSNYKRAIIKGDVNRSHNKLVVSKNHRKCITLFYESLNSITVESQ